MATKNVCINAADCTYTGKENTPQGLGYAASGEIVGKMMHGRDGNLYMVIVKNRERTWKKVSEDIANRMAKEMPLITKVVTDVKQTAETVDEIKPVEPAKEVASPEIKPVEVAEEKPTSPEIKPVEVAEEAKPVKEKKPRKPRAKKTDTQSSTTEEKQVSDEEVAKPADDGENTEAKPVKEKKPRKPRAKKTEEAKPVEEGQDSNSDDAKPTEEEAKQVKEKKPRKPRAKKTEETKPAEEGENAEEKPDDEKKPRKPRAKKTDTEKKERKPRAPTEYNKFLGIKLKELKISHPDLPREEYMKMAVEQWKEHKATMTTTDAPQQEDKASTSE